jgi:hypothetical protein
VNPVCVEKTNDDGSIKFRTRLTIGGDRIQYLYDTSAVTAEMDAIKILLNCMISEDADWTTIDLPDFYLGTDLPHPEYIRIPRNFIPHDVIAFYELDDFFSNDTLYRPLWPAPSRRVEPETLVQAPRSSWIPSDSKLPVCLPEQHWIDSLFSRG